MSTDWAVLHERREPFPQTRGNGFADGQIELFAEMMMSVGGFDVSLVGRDRKMRVSFRPL